MQFTQCHVLSTRHHVGHGHDTRTPHLAAVQDDGRHLTVKQPRAQVRCTDTLLTRLVTVQMWAVEDVQRARLQA